MGAGRLSPDHPVKAGLLVTAEPASLFQKGSSACPAWPGLAASGHGSNVHTSSPEKHGPETWSEAPEAPASCPGLAQTGLPYTAVPHPSFSVHQTCHLAHGRDWKGEGQLGEVSPPTAAGLLCAHELAVHVSFTQASLGFQNSPSLKSKWPCNTRGKWGLDKTDP